MQRLKLGTRGSPLALKQADMVRTHLKRVHPDLDVEIITILTSGDWKPSDGETRLSEEKGGKGQFAKEIEQALVRGDIDIAVHSMKDMESNLPDGLEIPWILPREDARDVLILNSDLSKNIQKMSDLPHGCRVGTSSVRRTAFALSKRPDLVIEPFRGNVQTRLDKLAAGQVEATFLALAGLKRLGLDGQINGIILEPEDMLPAAAQGAVGIEILSSRKNYLSFIGQISCEKTYSCVAAEREALRILDGSCHTPIGAYATWQDGDTMRLRIQVTALDGLQSIVRDEMVQIHNPEEARTFGARLADGIKTNAPAHLFV